MTLRKLTFRPGINKNDTSLAVEPGWVDGDKVRFRFGQPEKIGGWANRLAQSGFPYLRTRGPFRTLHTWTDLNGVPYVALGSHTGVFIIPDVASVEDFSEVYEITPVQNDAENVASARTQIFGTTSVASFVVNTSNVSPGSKGIYVSYPVASLAVFTNALEQGHRLVTIGATTDLHLYDSDGTEGDTGTITSVNASANFRYHLEIGLADNETVSAGFTGGRVTKEARIWSLDNWGQQLLGSFPGDTLYYWDPTSIESPKSGLLDYRWMHPVSQAPDEIYRMFTTKGRPHVVALGTSAQGGGYDPMLVRWSDVEDYTNWNAATSNLAGDYRLQDGSLLMGAAPTKTETLIFSDTAAFSMRETTGTDAFRFETLGTNCGLVGPHAAAVVDDRVFWMSAKNFYMFDGRVQQLPSTLDDVLFDPQQSESVNAGQALKVHAGVNRQFNEIWWFYPSKDSTENNRYVVYNYAENLWYDGSMQRTSWIDSRFFQYPLAANVSSLFVHEFEKDDTEWDAVDNDWTRREILPAYLKSSKFDIADGQEIAFVRRFVPDFEQTGDVEIKFGQYKYPYADPTYKSYIATSTDNMVNTRVRGRQLDIEIRSSVTAGNFEWGTFSIDSQPDGDR